MTKLWIFGDSYSVSLDFSKESEFVWEYDTNWIELVAQKLKVNETIINSNYGVSNEFIFKELVDSTRYFSAGDYVIVQLTCGDRHWFFENEPSQSNIVKLINPGWPKDRKKAVEYYLRYLKNDNLDGIWYTTFIYSLLYLQASMPQVKFLFIPGWSGFPNVLGNLTYGPCEGEFDSEESRDMFYKKHNFLDPRLNHLSIENHHILSDKIFNYFTKNEQLDLTDGFKTAIYTKNNI